MFAELAFDGGEYILLVSVVGVVLGLVVLAKIGQDMGLYILAVGAVFTGALALYMTADNHGSTLEARQEIQSRFDHANSGLAIEKLSVSDRTIEVYFSSYRECTLPFGLITDPSYDLSTYDNDAKPRRLSIVQVSAMLHISCGSS